MVQELEQMRGVEQVTHPEIAELEESLVDLSRQILRDGIHYDLIIGDDTSGRIPTLILGQVLRKVYESSHENRPYIRFVRGRRGLWEETRREVDSVLTRLGKKPKVALVVTEYVETGDRLASITFSLHHRAVEHDIAALFLRENPRNLLKKGYMQRKSRLYYHEHTPYVPAIWGKERLTGLVRKSDINDRVLSNPYFRSQINSARRDVKLMAERVLRQI